ncbi:protein of unknown function [Candidatus Methylomirabilis oxygeniifera]|uniref:Uncharacterized protein n=1 Tax=Methylomirabilis oxygeniifera TaxID=671143 RepID=D5MH42_METO1|nr:protein of unknown function [Candidatus Methylomirabilis oxyfera]
MKRAGIIGIAHVASMRECDTLIWPTLII